MEQAQIQRKKVLHVGCSVQAVERSFSGPEWQEVRLDIDPSVNPDIVASMTDLSMIPDDEFDAIWSSHNVEHLYPHDVVPTFKGFYRILKPGGGLYMSLPDLQSVAEPIAKGNLEGLLYQSNAGPISPIDVVYGHRASMSQGNLFMAHKMGFTAHTMANYLKKAGFQHIRVRRDTFDLNVAAGKVLNIKEPKIEVMDKDYNKIMEQRDALMKEPEMAAGWQMYQK